MTAPDLMTKVPMSGGRCAASARRQVDTGDRHGAMSDVLLRVLPECPEADTAAAAVLLLRGAVLLQRSAKFPEAVMLRPPRSCKCPEAVAGKCPEAVIRWSSA